MSLLQMSFSGAVLIAVIAVLRAIFIDKLPKKTFLVLWWVALLRLVVPFSVPFMFSVYSFVNQNTSVMERISGTPVASMVPVIFAEQLPVDHVTTGRILPQNIWLIIWLAGMIVCVAFFAISYLRCSIEFQASLPVENAFVQQWIENHSLMRIFTVRQSSKIHTPLTYGFLRPVILMPKKTDWENEQELQYILSHEYVHICRYDTVVKLILTLTLCIHWFNPMVWIMYILFNRDIELACDENVVRKFGENARSIYARTLISMEEKKGGYLPLCNSFSKNAIEERVRSIMNFKRISATMIAVAVLLIGSVTMVFATTAESVIPTEPEDFAAETEIPAKIEASEESEMAAETEVSEETKAEMPNYENAGLDAQDVINEQTGNHFKYRIKPPRLQLRMY